MINWKSKALLLWGEYIRLTQQRCQMCGSYEIEAHHLISRGVDLFCCDENNGLLLCSYDHKYNSRQSPHKNKKGFLWWLENHFPKRYEWYIRNQYENSSTKVDFKEKYFHIKGLIENKKNKNDSLIRRLK